MPQTNFSIRERRRESITWSPIIGHTSIIVKCILLVKLKTVFLKPESFWKF